MKALKTFKLFELLGDGMNAKLRDVDLETRENHPEIYIPPSIFHTSAGRSQKIVREHERSTGMTPRAKNGKRTIEDLLSVQAHFKAFPGISHPKRKGKTKAIVISVLNQKGGAGKTSTTLNIGHALALRGYRILLVDADAQASLTTQHGLIPDDDVANEQTLYSAFMPQLPEALPVSKLPQQTRWRNIDLIPSNLYLSAVSEDVTREAIIKDIYERQGVPIPPDEVGSDIPPMDRIKKMIETIQAEALTPYDLIIFDTPPAIGADAYNYLRASDILLIPVPPDRADIASTTSFHRIINEYFRRCGESGLTDIDYCDVSMVLTKMPPSGKRPGTEAKTNNAQIFRDYFTNHVFKSHITESVSLANAAEAGMSVIEMQQSSKKYMKSCAKTAREYLAVAAELNEKILAGWDRQIEEGI